MSLPSTGAPRRLGTRLVSYTRSGVPGRTVSAIFASSLFCARPACSAQKKKKQAIAMVRMPHYRPCQSRALPVLVALAAALQIRFRRGFVLQRSDFFRVQANHQIANVIVDAREQVPGAGGNHYDVTSF